MAAAAERRSVPDWSSGLPQKVLESIAKKLPSGQDAASFRLVCSPWCAALPFERFTPVLMLPFDPEGDVTFYSVMDDMAIDLRPRGKVVCGASHGWLALMDEAASVTLLNPFTGGTVELPPADKNVALASFKTVAKVDGGGWVLRYTSGAAKPIQLNNMRDIFFREIVLSAPPANSGGVDCKAMAVLANSAEIAFCRPGDTAWTLIDAKLECPVTSVVYCQDRFVAIGFLGEISIFSSNADDAAPLTASPLLLLPPPAHIHQRSYLHVNGQLHLVGAILRVLDGTWYETVVYKCDIHGEMPWWSKVTDAQDMALFVSRHFNTGFGVASISMITWNCVYLSEPMYCQQEDEGSDHHLEMVDITTNTSVLQAYRPTVQGLEALCWIRPNLCS